MTTWTLRDLEYWDERIKEKVEAFGLDCYPQEFEVCDTLLGGDGTEKPRMPVAKTKTSRASYMGQTALSHDHRFQEWADYVSMAAAVTFGGVQLARTLSSLLQMVNGTTAVALFLGALLLMGFVIGLAVCRPGVRFWACVAVALTGSGLYLVQEIAVVQCQCCFEAQIRTFHVYLMGQWIAPTRVI